MMVDWIRGGTDCKSQRTHRWRENDLKQHRGSALVFGDAELCPDLLLGEALAFRYVLPGDVQIAF